MFAELWISPGPSEFSSTSWLLLGLIPSSAGHCLVLNVLLQGTVTIVLCSSSLSVKDLLELHGMFRVQLDWDVSRSVAQSLQLELCCVDARLYVLTTCHGNVCVPTWKFNMTKKIISSSPHGLTMHLEQLEQWCSVWAEISEKPPHTVALIHHSASLHTT